MTGDIWKETLQLVRVWLEVFTITT